MNSLFREHFWKNRVFSLGKCAFARALVIREWDGEILLRILSCGIGGTVGGFEEF